MISLRKTLVTLLAPIGAATIIGTGFAYWTFNMSPVTVEADPISNSANITGEVTNGNVELLSIPSILVFSEGSQGASDPFDGLSFYSHKPIQEGVEFDITLGNDNEHMLSLIYTNVSNNPMVYFSWSENNQYSSIISGELTQTTTSDSYVGTWTGTGKNGAGNLFDVTLTLNTLDQTSNSGTGRFQIALDEGQSGISFATVDDNFSYSPISSSTIPDITITDSTLSFKYTYDDSIFVDEDQTGYELNVKMRLSLESREPVVINPTKESGGQHLIYSGTGYTFMMGVNNDGTFNLEVVVSGQKIYFPNLTLSRIDGNGDTTFPNGVYSGESLSRIPCEVTLQSNGNDTFTATIEMGKMDHYLEVVDNFTSRVNPEDGYYSITTSQNETYSEAVLGFDIDRTHLNDEDSPYLTFTCQLATFIRYASINVKPVDPQSFFGLQVASTYGGWKLRVQICADFVSTRG